MKESSPLEASKLTAMCYKKAFWGDPWNEAFKKDGQFYPATPELLTNWRKLGYERAYPLEETTRYIQQELARPDAVFIQINNPESQTVDAFGWGFSYQNPESLITEKWPTISETDFDALYRLIARWTGTGKFWYLSEVGVRPSAQRQGLGTAIVQQLLEKSPKLPIIMRSNAFSPMTIIASNTGFGQILGPVTYQSNGGIEVSQNMTVGIKDPINSERVLFVKDPVSSTPAYLVKK